MLDGSTGTTAAELGPEVTGCRAGAEVVACITGVAGESHLVSLADGDTEPRTSGQPVAGDGEILIAPDGAIAIGPTLVDRSGNPLGELPARPAAFSAEATAVFTEPRSIAVHAAT